MLLHGVIPDTSVLIMSKNRETVLDTLRGQTFELLL